MEQLICGPEPHLPSLALASMLQTSAAPSLCLRSSPQPSSTEGVLILMGPMGHVGENRAFSKRHFRKLGQRVVVIFGFVFNSGHLFFGNNKN